MSSYAPLLAREVFHAVSELIEYAETTLPKSTINVLSNITKMKLIRQLAEAAMVTGEENAKIYISSDDLDLFHDAYMETLNKFRNPGAGQSEVFRLGDDDLDGPAKLG